MKRTLLLLCLLSLQLASLVNAQNSRTIYFAADGKASSKANASYYSIITPDKKDTTRYAVETFFLSGDLKESGDYVGRSFPIAWEKLLEPSFHDAVRDGLWKEYFENKQLKFEGEFRRGVSEGRHRRWYESGKLLSEINLVNGREEGQVTSYYENGKLKLQYEVSNGLAEGELLEYYTDGRKKARATFRKNVLVGEVILFDGEGKEVHKK